MLTRQEMEAVIAGGGSVLIGGRVLSRAADLPTEADLTAQAGDPEATQAVVARLEAQIAELAAQVARLTSPAPPADETPPADPTAETESGDSTKKTTKR